MYWCCAQIEPFRERLALHCLGLNGFKIYCPRLREQIRSRGRKIVRTPPLFPGYAFVLVVSASRTDQEEKACFIKLNSAGKRPAGRPTEQRTVLNSLREFLHHWRAKRQMPTMCRRWCSQHLSLPAQQQRPNSTTQRKQGRRFAA
jgi:hypothetical protein